MYPAQKSKLRARLASSVREKKWTPMNFNDKLIKSLLLIGAASPAGGSSHACGALKVQIRMRVNEVYFQ